MSTTLDLDPANRVTPRVAPSQQLRMSTAAVRLAFTWMGVRKSLSSDQKAQAADAFGAEHDSLSASKRLLDVRHPAFRGVNAVKGRITSYWKGVSLPYPEPAIRLIRQDRIEVFNQQLADFREELQEAVDHLEQHYIELRSAARQRLGSLYDPSDYPASLDGMFAVAWEFVTVEPPSYLRQLNPEIYQEECARVQARFSEAVELAEAAFLDELHRLVAHLTERLTGQSDGKPKVFRDSAVANLTERFRDLNIGSSEQLDQLVDQAHQIVRGVQPQSLRDNRVLRQSVAEELTQVQSVLDELLVDRPRRNILRKPN